MFKTLRTDLGSRVQQCHTHGEFTSRGQTLQIGRTGRDIWTTCLACDRDRSEATGLKAIEAREAYLHQATVKAITTTGIPARFVGKTFDSYQAETPEQERALRLCQRYAGNFEKVLATGRTLILLGQPGTGKTHLSCAVLQALIPQHVGAYITTMDLIRKLRGSWGGRAGSETEVLQELADLPLLVVDEIGVQFGSDGERIHLHDVIDRRYRDMKPTILITNLDDKAFQAYVGDRVYDRLTEVGTWINFTWESHRAGTRKEYA